MEDVHEQFTWIFSMEVWLEVFSYSLSQLLLFIRLNKINCALGPHQSNKAALTVQHFSMATTYKHMKNSPAPHGKINLTMYSYLSKTSWESAA